MIPATDFIPAYSELLKTMARLGGREAVHDFWNGLATDLLERLPDVVAEQGVRGCWLYWNYSLGEGAGALEGGALDEGAASNEFSIFIRNCPHKGVGSGLRGVERLGDYCSHCDVLYVRVLSPMGYDCRVDTSHCDEGYCVLHARRRTTG